MNIEDIIKKYEKKKENLVPILTEVQALNKLNYIDHASIKIIANELGISESRVFSVISFYTTLSIKPRGKYIIQVCNNLPCYINGSLNIIETLEATLNIKMKETTSDNLFTLEYSSCLGCCNISPVIRINGTLYGNLTQDKLITIISNLKGGNNND